MTTAPPSLGLSRVGVRLPRSSERVDDVLTRAGVPAAERRVFTRFHGLRDTPTLGPGEHLPDLLADAAREALGGGGADLVLYGHTHLIQGFAMRPGFTDRLRARLGLSGAPFHGISQVGCTSVLRSVELARRFLLRPAARPGERVLVLGGDHGSFHDSARILPRNTVASDTAVAVTVGREPDGPGLRYRHLGAATLTDPRFHRNLRMTGAELADHGRACVTLMARVMDRAARAAGGDLTGIDLVMPHLSTTLFWKAVGRAAGVPAGRVCLDLLPERGHGFGTDALMALEHADTSGRLRPGDRCLLASTGQGAYFTAVVVEVLEEP